MAIADNWSLDYDLKTITYVDDLSGATYTLRELYSYLMSIFDDAVQMDDTIPMKYLTPVEYEMLNSWTIPDASMGYLYGGSLKYADGTIWTNLYTLGSIHSGAQVYVIQGGSEVTFSPTLGTDHVDFLIKTNNAGTPIEDEEVLVMIRDTAYNFDHYLIDCADGGRKAVPLATNSDINNTTSDATIAGWTTPPTVTFGTVSKDLGNGNGSKDYDVLIDCNGYGLNDVYEYLKYVTRHNAGTIPGTAVDGETYLSAYETYTEEKAAPFGTYAGGQFFGARGVWIEGYDADDANNFELIAADGTTQVPPLTVSVKVTGLVVGDRVLVGQLDGVGGDLTGTYYIDKAAEATEESYSHDYSANIPVLVRVRKYGILPFEVESTITSNGMSVAAIRNDDTVVL